MGKKPEDKKMLDREDKQYKSKSRKGGKGKPKQFTKPKDGDVNDSSFYYLDATLRDQLMNYSFNSFNGMPDEFNCDITGNPGFLTTGTFMNGNVMSIYLYPSVTPPLNPNAPTDGINLVSMRNYTVLSANNAKTTSYAPQDVTILMLALKALTETVCWVTRSFGLLYLYNQRNREIPDKLLKANYVDPDDFRKNAAAYRVRFNTMLTAINRIPFFDNFGAFQKAKEIYTNVYIDDPSPMCQYYQFVPKATWLFDEQYDSNGSGLKTWMNYNPNSYMYMSVILDDLQTMIDALLNSSSLNYIYSDVLRLFEKGSGNLMHFDLVPDFYALEFKMSDEIALYVENLMCIGNPQDSAPGANDRNDVSCDANVNLIKYNPTWSSSNVSSLKYAWGLFKHGLLNFDKPNPDVEARVAATRLAARMVPVITNASLIESLRVAIGDYYVGMITISDCYNNSLGTKLASIYSSVVEADSSLSDARDLQEIICQLSKFKHAPKLYVYSPNLSNSNNLLAITGDLNYYTDVEYDLIRSMFDAEMIGEFALRV